MIYSKSVFTRFIIFFIYWYFLTGSINVEINELIRGFNHQRYAFQGPLRIYSPDNYPSECSLILDNIGVSYSLMADIQDRKENLINAITAIQEALIIYSGKISGGTKKIKTHLERVKQRL
jgi:hypothetical protein